MDRIKTDVPGFDDMMLGGLVPGSINLLSGAPGTGKTIFSLQYLYNGATKYNQKGLYLSFEQLEEDIISQAKNFGWAFDEMIKQERIGLYTVPVNILDEEIVGMVIRLIEAFKPERLVIDSISTFSIAAPTYAKLSGVEVSNTTKYFIYKFLSDIRKLNCTTIVTSELHQDEWISKGSVAEFIADSVFVFRYFGAMGESSRTLSIKKARQTRFDEFIHSFNFTEQGINVNKNEKFEFSGK